MKSIQAKLFPLEKLMQQFGGEFLSGKNRITMNYLKKFIALKEATARFLRFRNKQYRLTFQKYRLQSTIIMC